MTSIQLRKRKLGCIDHVQNDYTVITDFRAKVHGSSISRCPKSSRALPDQSGSQPEPPSVVAEICSCLLPDSFLLLEDSECGNVPSRRIPAPCHHRASLLFPDLPTAISDSSCSASGIPRLSRESQKEEPSTSSVDSSGESGDTDNKYGWFVEMVDATVEAKDFAAEYVYRSFSTIDDLAFSAHMAPKCCSREEEAELAWAAAADTVDEVLADLL